MMANLVLVKWINNNNSIFDGVEQRINKKHILTENPAYNDEIQIKWGRKVWTAIYLHQEPQASINRKSDGDKPRAPRTSTANKTKSCAQKPTTAKTIRKQRDRPIEIGTAQATQMTKRRMLSSSKKDNEIIAVVPSNDNPEKEKDNGNDPNAVTLTDVQPKPMTLTDVQPNAVKLTDVQPNTVTLTNVQPKTVKLTNVQPNAVTLTDVQPNAVKLTDVQPNAETLTNVQPNTVKLTDVQQNAVTLTDVQPNAETLTDVQPNALTLIDVQPNTVSVTDVQPTTSTVKTAKTPRKSMPKKFCHDIFAFPDSPSFLNAPVEPTHVKIYPEKNELYNIMRPMPSKIEHQSCSTFSNLTAEPSAFSPVAPGRKDVLFGDHIQPTAHPSGLHESYVTLLSHNDDNWYNFDGVSTPATPLKTLLPHRRTSPRAKRPLISSYPQYDNNDLRHEQDASKYEQVNQEGQYFIQQVTLAEDDEDKIRSILATTYWNDKSPEKGAPVLARKLVIALVSSDELAKCSVMGRNGQAIDSTILLRIKGAIRFVYGKRRRGRIEFEALWTKCLTSVGHLCKQLRSNKLKEQAEQRVQAEKSPFSSLPTEVMVKIFSHLNTKEIIKTERVSKSFQSLARVQLLHSSIDVSNTNITDRDFDQLLNKLGCQDTVRSVTVRRCDYFTGQKLVNRPLFLRSLVELDVTYTGITNEAFVQIWNGTCSGAALKSIVAVDCFSMTDDLASQITQEHMSLEILQVSDYLTYQALLTILKLLPKLKLLEVDGIILESQEICEILQTVTSMTELYVPYALLNDQNLEDIFPYVGKLKSLNIMYSDLTANGILKLKQAFNHLTVNDCNR